MYRLPICFELSSDHLDKNHGLLATEKVVDGSSEVPHICYRIRYTILQVAFVFIRLPQQPLYCRRVTLVIIVVHSYTAVTLALVG
jgi:hypothetical protein